MSHTTRDKKKILNRIRRIRGQVNAIETALEEEQGCSSVLQTIAACRGAMNGLMVEILDGHISEHVMDPDSKPSPAQVEAARELMDLIKAYLK